MGYSLQFDPDVQRYLANCPGLSRADRIKLFGHLDTLRDQGDVYRSDVTRRLSLGSEHFSLDFAFRSESGDVRLFRFVVSDASASYGVLRIVYADER